MWEFILTVWRFIRSCCHAIDDIENDIEANGDATDANIDVVDDIQNGSRTISMMNQAPAAYVIQLHNSQNNTIVFSRSEPDLRMLNKPLPRDRSKSQPPPLVVTYEPMPDRISSTSSTPDSPQRPIGLYI